MRSLPQRKPVLPSSKINELIDIIAKAKPAQHVIGKFVEVVEPSDIHNEVEEHLSCGTAACVAGWATLARGKKAVEDPDGVFGFNHYKNLRHFIGKSVPEEVLEHIVTGTDHDGVSEFGQPEGLDAPATGIRHVAFDQLDGKVRKRAMLKMLRHFRDTGEVRWSKSAPAAVRY